MVYIPLMSGKYYPERSRSRDKHHHSSYRGRSESSESDHQPRKQSELSKGINKTKKRVKQVDSRYQLPDTDFLYLIDDSGSTKMMIQESSEKKISHVILEYMKKIESEKGPSLVSTNWDNAKRFDAKNQNNLIRERKEKQKILAQKLQSMKSEIDYFSPLTLKLPLMEVRVEPGCASAEKDAHSTRLNDVLGCFYVHWKQTPSEPTFQIQNQSTSCQPKNISFDKLSFDNMKDQSLNTRKKEEKDSKQIKGILKLSGEELKKQKSSHQNTRIDPKLIEVIRQINNNKVSYLKQKQQALLRPYKQSGELDNLMKNPELLSSLLRTPSQEPARPVQAPVSGVPPYRPYPQSMRHSPSPQSQPPRPQNNYMPYRKSMNQSGSRPSNYPEDKKPYYRSDSAGRAYPENYNHPYQPVPYYLNPPNNVYYPNYPASNQGGSYNAPPPYSNPIPKSYSNRKYKTEPCKYFHSVQGCVKGNNCTYIHDEKYAGEASPLMRQYSGMANSGQSNRHRQSMERQMHNKPKEGYYMPPHYQPSNYPSSSRNNMRN